MKKVLLEEFEKCQNWAPEKIAELAQKTGLSYHQVYKWRWDKVKTFNPYFGIVPFSAFTPEPTGNERLKIFKVERVQFRETNPE